MADATNPITRTVHELSASERDAAVDAFTRAHGEPPEWNMASDRAWLEGYAAGRTDGVKVPPALWPDAAASSSEGKGVGNGT